jgi:hypothetical protein
MSSCSGQPQKKEEMEKEDLIAKEWLQGTWKDDMTETPLFTAKGDTIYYIDEPAAPVAFKIIEDTLKTYGRKVSNYHIKKQGKSFIWIQSFMGDILQLSKAENSQDSLWIPRQTPKEKTDNVISKDNVVHYNNQRFRGYVYINPTNIKVHQPEITEEGLEIENIYYDNIIHICVYEGKNKLFGRDMKKQDFESLIPAEYYQRAILSDMEFGGVNAKGYQYQATLCIPNSASCYLINISITKDGDITYELVQ